MDQLHPEQGVAIVDAQSIQPVQQVPPPNPAPALSQLARALLVSIDKQEFIPSGKRLSVNPVVAKFGSWYERLRNVMEYREEEMMLRAAIERILRRRLLLGGSARTTAEPLIRELMWARYLPSGEVPESMVPLVEDSIDLHLRLRVLVLQRHKIPEHDLNELIYQIMSADIAHIIQPNYINQVISNFMYHILRNDVVIVDDNEQTRDAQVYMAIRKSFAKDDLAFLKYHILQLYFGKLTRNTLETIAEDFMQGYQELLKELHYPRKETIYSFIKKKTSAFLILEDIVRTHKNSIQQLTSDKTLLERAIYNSCEEKYNAISSKVRRAVVRSVFFILLTKVMFAFAVEGTYERLVYGHILYTSILINTSVPPLLMLIVSLSFRAPGVDNTQRIQSAIEMLLFQDKPQIGEMLTLKKRRSKPSAIFSALWWFAFLFSFGFIVSLLKIIGFNFVSIGIFLFFLAIVSFLAYRISLTAHLFRMGERQSLLTPFIDFLFMPIVRVGRELTSNISKVNILLFIFDFFIETPFKILFAFFEQWFIFLHAKREELE